MERKKKNSRKDNKERSRDKEREKEKDQEKANEKETKSMISEDKKSKSDEDKQSEKELNNIIVSNTKNDNNNNNNNNNIIILKNENNKLSFYNSTIQINKETLYQLLTCPLCNGIFRTPYTINECMHSFCKSCIYKWFIGSAQKENCPVCKTKIGGRPIDSLIINNNLETLLNILFPQFEEIDKENMKKLYAIYRNSGDPLPGDEEEMKTRRPNIKIYIASDNPNNKYNGSIMVPINFDINSLKMYIGNKCGSTADLIIVKYKDKELPNDYTMEVIENKLGFDDEKNIFFYGIKKKV